MWMFVKIFLAMSAAAGIAAVPTAVFSHHSQSHTTGEVTVQSDSDTNLSSHANADGSSHTSTSVDQTSAGTVTVHTGTGGSAASGHSMFGGSIHGSGGVSTSHPVPPVPPLPPVPVPPLPQIHPSTVTWGTVKSFGNGHITLSCKGQPDKTFTVDGNTRIITMTGPIQPLDDESGSISRLHVGDNVMIVAKGSTATMIVDHGTINGRYVPLGGGTGQGGVNTRLSGAMQMSGQAR